MYQRFGKRALDILLSGAGLIALLPVLLIVAALVRIKLGRPVLFCQNRPGKDGKIFKLYKFRTMTDKKDCDGNLLPDEARLTEFGKQLRSASLDELPELFNILRGDMSIVGPRPLLEEYLPLYNARQRKRHKVRPGLTGLAQINGRNQLSWEEKFELDIKYVENISLAEDIRIFIHTIGAVLSRKGIGSETSATMEKFMGEQQEKCKKKELY